MRSARAASEQPDLERAQLLDDARDEVGWYGWHDRSRLRCFVNHSRIIATFLPCESATQRSLNGLRERFLQR